MYTRYSNRNLPMNKDRQMQSFALVAIATIAVLLISAATITEDAEAKKKKKKGGSAAAAAAGR